MSRSLQPSLPTPTPDLAFFSPARLLTDRAVPRGSLEPVVPPIDGRWPVPTGTGASAPPLPLAGTLDGRRPRRAPPSSPRAVLPDSLRAGSSETEFGDSRAVADSPGSVCPPAPARPPDSSSDVPGPDSWAAGSADPADRSVSRIPSAPASSLPAVAGSEGPHSTSVPSRLTAGGSEPVRQIRGDCR